MAYPALAGYTIVNNQPVNNQQTIDLTGDDQENTVVYGGSKQHSQSSDGILANRNTDAAYAARVPLFTNADFTWTTDFGVQYNPEYLNDREFHAAADQGLLLCQPFVPSTTTNGSPVKKVLRARSERYVGPIINFEDETTPAPIINLEDETTPVPIINLEDETTQTPISLEEEVTPAPAPTKRRNGGVCFIKPPNGGDKYDAPPRAPNREADRFKMMLPNSKANVYDKFARWEVQQAAIDAAKPAPPAAPPAQPLNQAAPDGRKPRQSRKRKVDSASPTKQYAAQAGPSKKCKADSAPLTELDGAQAVASNKRRKMAVAARQRKAVAQAAIVDKRVDKPWSGAMADDAEEIDQRVDEIAALIRAEWAAEAAEEAKVQAAPIQETVADPPCGAAIADDAAEIDEREAGMVADLQAMFNEEAAKKAADRTCSGAIADDEMEIEMHGDLFGEDEAGDDALAELMAAACDEVAAEEDEEEAERERYEAEAEDEESEEEDEEDEEEEAAPAAAPAAPYWDPDWSEEE